MTKIIDITPHLLKKRCGELFNELEKNLLNEITIAKTNPYEYAELDLTQLKLLIYTEIAIARKLLEKPSQKVIEYLKNEIELVRMCISQAKQQKQIKK